MHSAGRAQARIDPTLVPDGEYEVACSVLASSIRLALMNPELRKDYEDWKAARGQTDPPNDERS